MIINAYKLRNYLKLVDFDTAIQREEFENTFVKTKEKITFTFDGWDGKSYDGESRRASVYHTRIKGYEDVRFVKVGKGIHYIEEDEEVLEKTTGEYHKRASWLIDVRRA